MRIYFTANEHCECARRGADECRCQVSGPTFFVKRIGEGEAYGAARIGWKLCATRRSALDLWWGRGIRRRFVVQTAWVFRVSLVVGCAHYKISIE